MDVWIHVYFTSTLVGSEWSGLRPGRFTPVILWIGGWVGCRTCPDAVENRKILPLPGLEIRHHGLPRHTSRYTD
jgi:hypothetical protein